MGAAADDVADTILFLPAQRVGKRPKDELRGRARPFHTSLTIDLKHSLARASFPGVGGPRNMVLDSKRQTLSP